MKKADALNLEKLSNLTLSELKKINEKLYNDLTEKGKTSLKDTFSNHFSKGSKKLRDVVEKLDIPAPGDKKSDLK